MLFKFMAKYILIAIIVLLSCNYTYAQFDIPEINKVKEIKPLESDTFEMATGRIA